MKKLTLLFVAARKVKVTGTLDASAKTIQVQKIEAAE